MTIKYLYLFKLLLYQHLNNSVNKILNWLVVYFKGVEFARADSIS